MKALVTGASGFVGQYLVKHLLDCGDTVVACHSSSEVAGKSPLLLSHPLYPIIEKRAQWEALSIAERPSVSEVIRREQPDVIYHLAAIAFVPEAEENFDRAMSVNVSGTFNVYEACERFCEKTTIVLISSAEVYGRILPIELPINEETPLRPCNNYSLTKLMAEDITKRFANSKKIRSVIIRPFNHIGAGQNERFVAPNFARQLAEISHSQLAPVLSVGNLAALRDFTDVKDIVRGYRLAAEKGSGVYNMGSGVAVPVESILRTLIEVAGLQVTLQADPARMRASEVPEVRADISKARRELGWEPQIKLRETLAEVYQHELKRCVNKK